MPVPPELSTSNLVDKKGKRLSEPADLPVIIDAISELRAHHNTPKPLPEITLENARSLFSQIN